MYLDDYFIISRHLSPPASTTTTLRTVVVILLEMLLTQVASTAIESDLLLARHMYEWGESMRM